MGGGLPIAVADPRTIGPQEKNLSNALDPDCLRLRYLTHLISLEVCQGTR